MGPTWGRPGADRTKVGPMLAPWTLLSGWVSPTRNMWSHTHGLSMVRANSSDYMAYEWLRKSTVKLIFGEGGLRLMARSISVDTKLVLPVSEGNATLGSNWRLPRLSPEYRADFRFAPSQWETVSLVKLLLLINKFSFICERQSCRVHIIIPTKTEINVSA